MAFRFQKRIKILPGITLNVSKSGVSTSVGPRGAKVNIGKRGVKGTVGVPGTGASYSARLSKPSLEAVDQAPKATGGIRLATLVACGFALLILFMWLSGR